MGWFESADLSDMLETIRKAIASSPFTPHNFIDAITGVKKFEKKEGYGSKSGGNYVESTVNSVVGDILKGQGGPGGGGGGSRGVGPQTLWEEVEAFVSAISWTTDLWIPGLLAFHFTLILLTLFLRRNYTSQRNILFLVFPLILLSQPLNDALGRNYNDFSSQNYFDSRGVFAGVFWAGPLLVTGFLATINLVRMAGKETICDCVGLEVAALMCDTQHKLTNAIDMSR